MKVDINIVVVTYNNKDLLKKCIESIIKSVNNVPFSCCITVVDNASNDKTDEVVKNFLDIEYIKYIRNNKNLGLAKALNVGITSNINSKYTLLLNDDVELYSDTLKQMVDMLEKYPEAYGIPARLIYPDGTPQRIKLKIIGVTRKIKQNISFINFAGTTACLYRTEIFKKIGMFDEFYFFYNEDLDFSLRAKRSGLKFIFNPDIKVIHYRKKGRKKAEHEIKPYFYATDYYFYRKNYGILFSSIYFIMAFYHIKKYERYFRKKHDSEKLILLNKAKQKLLTTIKNFKKLAKP